MIVSLVRPVHQTISSKNLTLRVEAIWPEEERLVEEAVRRVRRVFCRATTATLRTSRRASYTAELISYDLFLNVR